MLQNIPNELKKNGQFCDWRREARPTSNKPAKVPCNPKTGQRANVSDPQTFGTFDEALQALPNGYDGIGILITNDLAAIDLDHVIDDQGHLSPMATEIVNIMNSYTERSPSGRGLRIICKVPHDFVFDTTKYYINNQSIGLEIYVAGCTSKYVSLTGDTQMAGAVLQDRAPQLMTVMDKFMRRSAPAAPVAAGQPQPPANCPQLSDNQVVQKIRTGPSGANFDALFSGDMSAYKNDHSSADMAFCNILAAVTKDASQIDRIFRSSKLMRPKWDSPRSCGTATYGSMTIYNAIQSAINYSMQNGATVAPGPAPGSTPGSTPGPAPGPVPAPISQTPKLISATELMKLQLPDPVAYVDDLFLGGTTTILASPPKSGKSWMSLQIATSVTTNAKFLGRSTTQASVLYLALEDGQKRLQNRLEKMLAGAPAPDNLYILNTAPTIADGLFERLDEYLQAHPDIKVIIIDTLAVVRTSDKAGTYSYAGDYEDMRSFKRYSETRRVALILVHHVRKSRDDSNPFNDISGTNGVTGAVDTMLVLERKRNCEEATLHITGRDVTEASLAIAWDRTTMRWESLGDAELLRQEREKQEFLSDELVQTVRELIHRAPNNTWSGQASDLFTEGTALGHDLRSAQAVGIRLNKLADSFMNYLGIQYVASNLNGNAGKKHSFTRCNCSDCGEAMNIGAGVTQKSDL